MTSRRDTPFPGLDEVLAELLAGVQTILGPTLLGAYLQGSFAMGEGDSHSDVDFLVVTRRDLSEVELTALQEMHRRLYDHPSVWAQHLEGSYIPWEILKRNDLTHIPLWYLDNGSRELVRSTHDNTLVVRWVVREYGTPLAGPPPAHLVDLVPADALRQEVRATMREWGHDLLADPSKIDSRWYQPFAVLSYCRMLQTLQTGRIHSKREGAEWARQALDERWAGLIERSWVERSDPWRKVHQPPEPAEVASTLAFIEYALALSRAWETGEAST